MKMFCIIHFILLRNQRWIVERLRKLLLKMWEKNPSICKYWVCWSDNLSLHFFLNKTDMPYLLVKRYTFSTSVVVLRVHLFSRCLCLTKQTNAMLHKCT